MTRIEYDLFQLNHPEFNLPNWSMLWQMDIDRITRTSRDKFRAILTENILVGRQTFQCLSGSRATIFGPE